MLFSTHKAVFVSLQQQFEFWRRWVFFGCGHVPKILDRLFNKVIFFRDAEVSFFSWGAWSRVVHSIVYPTIASFSLHGCLLNAVVDLLWGEPKTGIIEVVPQFSVIPMRVPCFLDFVCVTMALYTTPSCRDLPLNGHNVLSRQFQVLVNSSLISPLDMIGFLWFSIFCFILVMQL